MRQTRRGTRRPAGVRPDESFAYFAQQVFKALALQMRHVVVELGGKRLQRPSTRAPDDDLAQQVTGQLLCQILSRQTQNLH